jgi:hypothetical protein
VDGRVNVDRVHVGPPAELVDRFLELLALLRVGVGLLITSSALKSSPEPRCFVSASVIDGATRREIVRFVHRRVEAGDDLRERVRRRA